MADASRGRHGGGLALCPGTRIICPKSRTNIDISTPPGRTRFRPSDRSARRLRRNGPRGAPLRAPARAPVLLDHHLGELAQRGLTDAPVEEDRAVSQEVDAV